MSVLSSLPWLNAPAWLPLLHALLHTLWQGALAAGGLFLVLRFVPSRRAGLRYGLGAAALALVILTGVGTWALLDVPTHPPAGTTRVNPQSLAAVGRLPEATPSSMLVVLPVPTKGAFSAQTADDHPIKGRAIPVGIKWWMQWAAAGWSLGVSAFLLRAISGALGAGRLRRRCRDLVDPRVLTLAEQLRARLGWARCVRFLVCDEISVPSVLGILYPAVLLPASLLTGVPLEQLRAILAHELAHVRRWDYLANLAQMLAEALLFFNPFVWWISRQIRLEREACCDQVAAGECASPACYVEALLTVIERGRLRAAPPVLAASGPDSRGGHALERARRLLVPGYQPLFRVRWFSLAAVLVLAGSALCGLWWGTRAVAQTVRAAEEKTVSKPVQASQTVPGLPDDALAAAREGNAEQALSLLTESFKPRNFYDEDRPAHLLDGLVHARELRAFTTLHDVVGHTAGTDWKPSDELLAGLVKDGRTDMLDALLARRLDLDRLIKMAASAEPATAAWITRRVAEVARQRADIEALEKAAAGNDLPAMQRLVEGGADVNGVGQDDNTPLIRAVFKNRLEAAQWLLDHGAQVDKPRLPVQNFTPLSLVNSVPMAELLKKNGANIHAKLYGGTESLLSYAAGQAEANVVTWFLKQGLDANVPTANQENLLFHLKDGATAEVLLAAGADPNHVNEFGHTPLTSAHTAEVVRALVRHGADLKPRLKDGATLLEFAATHMQREDDTPEEEAGFIEELIRQGAEFDPKGNGVRVMRSAAYADEVGMVRALLDHGVSPNASYVNGPFGYCSALSAAAMQSPESLNLLLARGADPNAPVPAEQLNPLDAALLAGAFDNVETLRRAGAKGLSDLAYASAKGDSTKVGELLDQRADPNESDSMGRTPLLHAVTRGQVEAAKQLLEHGANADQFDLWGVSPSLYGTLYLKMLSPESDEVARPWHLSAPEAKARLAAFQELFRQHPPNSAYRNAAGRTALHQAAWNGSLFALSLMLDGKPPGFDPNALDKEGRTPLLLAALSPVARESRITLTVSARVIQIQNPQAHLAEKLLEAGARLDVVIADGKTVGELALAAARDAGNAQLVAVLTNALGARPTSGSASPPAADPPQDLADLKPEQRDTIWTAAYAAMEAGDIGTIGGFLRRGLDVNVDLENSSSLLYLAVDNNQLAIVKLLLAHGANVLQKTSWGDLPLKRACWRGYKEVADTLIAASAPKEELSYATGMGDVAALEARDQRQPISPKEARGNLFFAVASGHPNTFDFLWKKLGPMDDTEKGKLLGDLYENAGRWGHANLLPVLEALGATAAKDGDRALGAAIGGNYPETARTLLERGVPADHSSKFGRLRNAAGDGKLEIVRLLLDHGADINVQDDHGFTPLSWAGYCGHEDVCLLLLARGADGRIKDRDGHNAAWHAAAGPHCAEALARMIKAGVPVNEKDAQGATIMGHMTHFATPQAWKGAFFMKVYSPKDMVRFDASERRVVELLLAAGLDPDGPEGGPAPLTEAMHSQHLVMAQTLLEHGANATLRDKEGNLALYSLIGYAQDEFPLELLKMLLARSGDLNREITFPNVQPPMKTTYLDTLLDMGAEHPSSIASWREAAGILFDAGETFSGVSDAKAQALLQAATRGDLARIEESVQQGASISVAEEQGWDALSIAVALGYHVCADWLIDHGADVNSRNHWSWEGPLGLAVQTGQTELVEKLLAKGAKIDGVHFGLYMAVQQKNARIFDALLKAGADPTEKRGGTVTTGGKSFTPRQSSIIYLCIENGLTDMARTLLDKGADADPPNLENGRNLAYWAVEYDRSEILRVLLDHGANPLAKDDEGISALSLAQKSHPKMVPMLEGAAKRKSAPAVLPSPAPAALGQRP